MNTRLTALRSALLLTLFLLTAGWAWGQTDLAGWTFPSAPSATVIAAECGEFQSSANIYMNGTNGSSTFTGITGFAGHTPSTTYQVCNVDSDTQALAIVGTTNNNKGIVFKFPTTGYEDLKLSYSTRGTNTGYTTHVWSYSTDGIGFTNFETKTGRQSTSFSTQTIDFSSITTLDNKANVYIKVTISGATGNPGGNNRFDNIKFYATETTTADHTITVTQATGGTITPGTSGVNDGEDISFTAAADECHTFGYWVVDGSNAGNSNPYEFTNVTTDHNITAVFNATAPFTIMASAGANGSVSPNGATSVNCGASQIFTIIADSGYAVNDVLVDGVSVGTVNSYTFENVTENHTISASFIEYTGPCLEESFESDSPPAPGWIYSDVKHGTNNPRTGARTATFTSNNQYIISPLITSPSDLSFWYRRSSSSPSNPGFKVQVSTSVSGPWTDIGNITSFTTTYTEFTADLSSYSNLYIKILHTRTSGSNEIYLDDFVVFCNGSSNPADTHFRSQADGSWTNSSTWESSEDGISWHDATSYPGASAESVVILADHTVEINSPAAVVTNTTVYGTIEVTTAGAYSVEGEQNGIELTIENGGVFLVNSPGEFTVPAGNAFGLVKTGGKLVAGPNMGSGTAFVDAYAGYQNGIFYFGDGGICEWDNSSTEFGSSSPEDNDIFFPYEEGDMPILRIVTTPGYSFGNDSTDNVLNCVLEIIEPAAFTVKQGTSSSPQKTKTIVGGVRGSGKLIMEDNCGPLIIGGNGTYHLDNIVPELGGTATIVTNSTSDRLRFPNGATVPSGANFTIENNANAVKSFQRISGTFNINGTLDITNQGITNSNTGGISVNNGGTLRTRHTGGLWGTGSAIPGNTANLALNEGSTVEYYATENQSISSGKDYYHIIFSGEGIKTPQNATNVHTNGSITITGNPIVDYTGHNLGLTGSNTNFTMDGGKLIIGTGGTQPRPGGTYNISGGAIEFTGNSVTNIKVGPDYYDVIISGENKTPNGKTLNIQNILSVTPSGKFIIPSTPDFGSPDFESPYVINALKGVQVETGGELTFKNNAQLMQDADADNEGHIRMERKFTFSDMILGKQYNFVSAPVTNPDTDIKSSIYAPAIPQSVQQYNEANYYFYETNAPYIPGKGYAVQEVEGTDEIGQFTGTPNNGNNLSFMLKKSTPDGGFNLVGNPYPSNLDIDKLYSDNSNRIEPDFYFWDNRGNEQFTQQGSQYEGDHYAKYNALSTTGTSAAVGVGGTYEERIPTKNVKAMTGFMVQATANDVPLNFNNAQRLTESGPGFFGKGQNFDQPQMDRYWLTMETPGGISVMNAVVYFDQGNDNLWLDDTESFGGSDDLYTIADGHKLSIQGKAPFRINDELPLGYRAFGTGTHIISVYDSEGIFAESQDIWLIDRLLNRIVNLSRKPYKFMTRSGDYANRFKIIYRPANQPVDVNVSTNAVRLLKVGQQIEISSTIDPISEVEVFDLNSRPVFKKNEINQNKFSFDTNSFNHQIVIITVKTKTGETTTKKFVVN